jgi:HD-like signal output (HDOD) protein
MVQVRIIAARILQVLQRREPDFNQLVRIVSQDAATTVRLLHVASSVVFRADRPVENVRAAVLRMGMREAGEIALGLAMRSLSKGVRQPDRELRAMSDALFHESMTDAFAVGGLALRTHVAPDNAFMAGLFHDVGKPIALRSIAALRAAGELPPEVTGRALRMVLERVHVEIGAAMMRTWTMPSYLCEVAQHHHDPELPGDATLLHLVRVVDGLRLSRSGRLTPSAHATMTASIEELALSPAQQRAAASAYADHAATVSQMFGVTDPVSAMPAFRTASPPRRGAAATG